MTRWIVLGIITFITAPVSAQHHATASDAPGIADTYVVEGLRVGDTPPPGSAVGRAGLSYEDGGYVHIVYGKPFRRGRKIMGGLLGYGQVWAAGAHRATELFTSVSLEIGGERLEPGGYSLFVTPGEESWSIHVNSALGMHLADDYDAYKNVVTVEVIPTSLDEIKESLTWSFAPDGSAILLRWDDFEVALPIAR